MKRLKYTFRYVVEEEDIDGNITQRESFVEKSVPDNDTGRALAKKEAYDGVIVEYDDGQPEEKPNQPTDAEARIAALEEQLAAAKILLGVE